MKTFEAEKLEDKLLSVQRIVIAVDLTSRSEATALYAAEIAKCFNASLYVVHVFSPEPAYEFGGEGVEILLDRQSKELRARLDGLTAQLQKIVPTCESTFLVGEPAEQISGLARNVNADLIVTASHHPTLLGRLFNLDKAPRIMHQAPCPVLVCHDKNKGFLDHRRETDEVEREISVIISDRESSRRIEVTERERKPKTILAPVNMAEEPGTALDFAVELAQRWKAQLHVIYVYSHQVSVPMRAPVASNIDWERYRLSNNLYELVGRIRERYSQTFAYFADHDSPAEIINYVATKLEADMIIISAHYKGLLAKLLFHSDADEIARKSTTPVLVYRPKS
jgi:nucleotide-binding universal stress UspA family protein